MDVLVLDEIIPKFTLNTICETAIGVNLDDIQSSQEYRTNIHKSDEFYVKRIINPFYHNNFLYQFTTDSKLYSKLIQKIHEFSSNIITKRRQEFQQQQNISNIKTEPEDLILNFKKKRYAMLDTLLSIEKSGGIDHNGICEEVNTFIFEGYDTTSVALIFSLLMLSLHQIEQQKCFDEIQNFPDDLSTLTIQDCNNMKYLECCIKESVRLYPPVPYIARLCTQTTTIDNLILPKGTNINLHIYDLHRDPNNFPNPEQFQPERFLLENIIKRPNPYIYIPFSAGPRNCIGQKFAMLEMKILLVNILKKYQLFPYTQRNEIIFQTGLVLRSKFPIKIKIQKR